MICDSTFDGRVALWMVHGLLYSMTAMSGLPRNESTSQVTLQYQHEITMHTFAESVLQSVQ